MTVAWGQNAANGMSSFYLRNIIIIDLSQGNLVLAPTNRKVPRNLTKINLSAVSMFSSGFWLQKVFPLTLAHCDF
jgi:hypothetical protein